MRLGLLKVDRDLVKATQSIFTTLYRAFTAAARGAVGSGFTGSFLYFFDLDRVWFFNSLLLEKLLHHRMNVIEGLSQCSEAWHLIPFVASFYDRVEFVECRDTFFQIEIDRFHGRPAGLDLFPPPLIARDF